jgi:hypothetical protein
MAVFAQPTHATINRRAQNIGVVIRIIYVVVALWYAPTIQAQTKTQKTGTSQGITDEMVRSIIKSSNEYRKTLRPIFDYTKRGGIFPPDLEQERVNSLPLPLDSVIGFIRLWEIDSLLHLLDKRVFSSIEELTYTVIAPAHNDYEKVWAIFRWLNLYVKYDEGVYDNCDYSAEVEPDKILKKRSTICVGYARMFDQMCFYAGIPSRIIKGTTSTPKEYKPLSVGALERYGHVWNHVIIEGRRYFCDPTWGINLTVFRFREQTLKSFLSEESSFFLRDPADVSKRHHYDRLEDHLLKTPLHHADRYVRFVPYSVGLEQPFTIQMTEKIYYKPHEKVEFDLVAPYQDESQRYQWTYGLFVYNHTTNEVVARVEGIQVLQQNSFNFYTLTHGVHSLTLFRIDKKKQGVVVAPDSEDEVRLMAQRVIVVGDQMPHLKSEFYCKEGTRDPIQLLNYNDSNVIVTDSIITLKFGARPYYTYSASLSGNLQKDHINPIAEELKNGIYTITFRAPSIGEYTCTVHGYDTVEYANWKKSQNRNLTKDHWQVVADIGISFRNAPLTLNRSQTAMLAVPQTEWLEHGKEVTIRFVMPDSVRNVRWVQNRDNVKKRELQPIIVQNHVATIITTPDIAKGDKVWFEYEYYDTTEHVMKDGGYYFHVGKRNEKQPRTSIGISAK